MSKSSPSDRFESGEFDPSVIKSLLKGFRLTKPLIAAVEGPAIAGGTEILQATDIRVAGESARFGVSEPQWGLYPLGGSAVRLPRQIPYTVAADLLLTGRHIKAPEAKEIGLIGHVVPDGEALAKAHEIADLIAANGPLAVQAVLQDDPRLRGQARGRLLEGRRHGRRRRLRLRRRQGGPAGVRGEADARVHRALGRGRHLSCRPCPSSTSGSSSSRSASCSSWWGSCAVAGGATRSPSGRPARAGSTSRRTARWSTASRASRSVAAAAAVRGT